MFLPEKDTPHKNTFLKSNYFDFQKMWNLFDISTDDRLNYYGQFINKYMKDLVCR